MVAQAPDRRSGRLAGAVAVAVLLAGLTLLLEPASGWPPAWWARCACPPPAASARPWSA
jgi:hypothetical protein